jgi:arylsulfatase A-like enzyme/Flp pilus assembly protein TadD
MLRIVHRLAVPLALGFALPPAAGAAPAPSIVLVSIDTLRSDRLPAYGYSRGATPAIDALVRDGILFEHAYAHTPLTLPSHASILSGLLPGAHGVRDNLGYRFDAAKHPHVPALLSAAGYATGAAVSSFVLRPETGLAAGFDLYEARLDPGMSMDLGDADRPGGETLRHARAFLERQSAGRPFFLFVHLYEPHSPYTPPEPFASRFADPYDGEVAAADQLVGELVADLKRLGYYDEAVIVLLSDHGEGLGDHGEAEHGVFLYREAIQVPLVLKLPKARKKGTRIDEPAQLVDVAPTLLELAGLPKPAAMSGTALTAIARGEPRAIYSETFYPRLHMGWSDLASVVRWPDHLIDGPDPELYQLERDPAEKQNRRDAERRTLHALRQAAAPLRVPLAAPAAEDPETAAKLAALGYLGSAGATGAAGPLPDPKARIATLADFGRATSLLAGKKNAEAAALLEKVTAANPGMVDAWAQLGSAYRRLKEQDKSLAAYQKALELSGGSANAALAMASILKAAERYDEAKRHAELALATSPVHAHLALASIALSQQDPAAAEAAARRAIELGGGGRVAPLLMLARAQKDQKRHDEALASIAEAERDLANLTTAEKTYKGLFLLRGDVLAESDRRGEAREAYRREIADFPDDPLAYARLARVLAAVGRRSDALKVVKEMIATAPEDPAIHRTAVQVLRAMREFPEADRVAKEAASRFPDDPSIRKLADRSVKIEEEDLP